MSTIRLADGSSGGERRMEAACVRAIDACMKLGLKADSVLAELDDMTLPGVVRVSIGDEDSLVAALQTVAKPD